MNRAAVRQKAIALQASAAPAIPASIQSQVMARVVALLNDASTAKTYRTRMTAFKLDDLPVRNVLPDEGEAEYVLSGTANRTFRFEIRHVVSSSDEVDAAVDLLYVETCQTLGTDPALGGLVTSLRESRQRWDLEKGEVPLVSLIVTYEVEFTTARFDPSKKVY